MAEVLYAARSSLLGLSDRTLRVAAVTGVDVAPETMEPADVDRIVATANAAEPKLRAIVLGLLDHIKNE